VPRVRLARTQSISVNGVALLGTRDFDINVDLDTADVTPWDSSVRGELTLTEMTVLTLEVYHSEDLAVFLNHWNAFPPNPISITIGDSSSSTSASFCVYGIKWNFPLTGVLSYEVVLKLWPYANAQN